MSTRPHQTLASIGDAIRASIPGNLEFLLIVYPADAPITPQFLSYTGSTVTAGKDPVQVAEATRRGLNAGITAANVFVLKANEQLNPKES
jgi:hypothetical protein